MERPEFRNYVEIDGLVLTAKGDFAGKDLSGLDLRRVDLVGANFSCANLQGTNFGGANLCGANFSRANLAGANFQKANLRGDHRGQDYRFEYPRNFTRPGILFRAQTFFVCADLSYANLPELDLSEVDFSGATLKHANLRGSSFVPGMSGTTLSAIVSSQSAILTGANLEGADLRDCRFGTYRESPGHAQRDVIGTWMAGANLHGANLEGTSLFGAYLPGAVLPDGSINHNYY